MRRITFFIGNGFDINVGLPTRYSQFYEYYKARYPKDMIANEIEKNYQYWADMEVGLGNYTKQIDEVNEVAFWQSEELLEQALADYLEMQTKNVSFESEGTATILKDSLMKFYEELPKAQRQDISNRITNIRDSITYSFISFNYTNTLDLCIDAGKEVFPETIGTHKVDNGVDYSHFIGNVLHLHGTINEELILGVNDTSQIANEGFRNKQLYRQLLIKEEANKRFGQNKTQDARSIIDGSEIICVFGASIGITDKMWWTYIGKWLQRSGNHRLIIFMKNDKPQLRITKHALFGGEDRVLQKFKDNSELSDEEWDGVRDKIYIKFDSRIFGFEIKMWNDNLQTG